MKVEQYVMAYGIEQDRVRAILPEGFVSLRPVLRINAEIRDEKNGYVEFNTAVEKDGKKGWLNIGYWENVPFTRNGKTTIFQTDFIFCLTVFLDWERRYFCLGQHAERFYTQFNLTCCKILIDSTASFFYHTGNCDHKFTSEFSRFCETFFINAAILKDQLHDT